MSETIMHYMDEQAKVIALATTGKDAAIQKAIALAFARHCSTDLGEASAEIFEALWQDWLDLP